MKAKTPLKFLLKPKSKNHETLERLKRWNKLIDKWDCMVYIWSGEHQAYWRPESRGYTMYADQAGSWHIKEAFKMTKHCCPAKQIKFIKHEL